MTLTGDSTINVGVGQLTVSAPVTGAFGITSIGAGTLALSGANTYFGPTTINAGITSILTSPGALGAITGGVVVASGATLQGAGTFSSYRLTLNGAGFGLLLSGLLEPIGALEFTGAGTWSGNINLASASTISAAGVALTVTGLISGAGADQGR